MSKKKLELLRPESQACPEGVNITSIPQELTEEDQARYEQITSIALNDEQRSWVLEPTETHPMQGNVIAVHWHPEFVPMDMIRQRVQTMYPNMQDSLLIPTQHNEMLAWNGYSGVEVDCYASGFKRKVQLLLHFKTENVQDERSTVLKAMLKHTFKYRSSQLFSFMDALIEDGREDWRQKAAAETGATLELVQFCTLYTVKLKKLLESNWTSTPDAMIKNKLIRNFFNAMIPDYGAGFIARAQVYLKAVKKIVKANFSLEYFYRASEVIEEARSLGAGVVIPHPEQFWPILLAGYDVDGYEVWNPQSQDYTEFLINVMNEQNRSSRRSRPLLVFMGDDCHMGEKTIAPDQRDPEKGSREIGYQPAWDDMAIRKSLIIGNVSRESVMEEYRSRLGG